MIDLALNIIAFIFLAFVAFFVVCFAILALIAGFNGIVYLIAWLLGPSKTEETKSDFSAINEDGKTVDLSIS